MLTRTWVTAGEATETRVRVTHPVPPAIGLTRTDEGPDWITASDQALVDASLAGHTAAFDIVVERYQRQVYQLCYRFVGNHEDASDLAQDVFVRAYRGLRGFRGRSALGTWIYRIAVNVSLNRMALKTPRTEGIDHREHRDTAIELPDAMLLRTERAAEVRAAVVRLPRKQRATLILRVYHELPHQEIAEILGIPLGTVMSRLHRARKLLRTELAAYANARGIGLAAARAVSS